MTKLDVLDNVPELKVCVGYEYNGRVIEEFPNNIRVLSGCRPVYEETDGWMTSTSEVRQYEDLPKNARKYVEMLSQLIGAPIEIISVGSERSQTIFKQDPFAARKTPRVRNVPGGCGQS